MTDKIEAPTPIPAVTMPSADLINYRFDQNDKKTEAISRKLDKIVSNFASKEDLTVIEERLNRWGKMVWGVVLAVIALAGGLIAAFVERGPHK